MELKPEYLKHKEFIEEWMRLIKINSLKGVSISEILSEVAVNMGYEKNLAERCSKHVVSDFSEDVLKRFIEMLESENT